MKLFSTPNSSVKSSAAVDDGDRKDSTYFPGCRKCANCNCEMCLASMSATLDLMPMSIQRSSLTKISDSSRIPRTPVSFNSSPLSTPKFNSTRQIRASPPLNSTGNVKSVPKLKREKRGFGLGFKIVKLILGIFLIFAVEFTASWMISRVLKLKMSLEVVRDLGEKSWVFRDLNERLMYLSNEANLFAGTKFSNGSSVDLTWEIIQDGLLLRSKCKLYESWFEELSVFGWPLQTSGLITTEFASQYFTLLSGRVKQWSNGEIGYTVRRANSSWTQEKWSASVVHLDPNTWILEYRRSSLVESRRLLTSALEFLNKSTVKLLQLTKRKFWVSFASDNLYYGFDDEKFSIPT